MTVEELVFALLAGIGWGAFLCALSSRAFGFPIPVRHHERRGHRGSARRWPWSRRPRPATTGYGTAEPAT